MLRRGLLYLAVGALVIVPFDVFTVRPAGAGIETCKTRCLWDQARFNGNMVELTDNNCKDFSIKSAANNAPDDGSKTAIFFYKQPGCQGNPTNPYGMKSKTQSPHVDAASATVKPATR
ncbi:MAG TPA: hypothetical protein VKO35_08135 [Acidimicrobiia bacterium]|nr:hypothetical protein [Acidimicrobiia bacterium]